MTKWGKNTYMKDFSDFGPIIKRHRIAAGMTQEDLCAATDYVLQNGYLSQLERKPKAVSFRILDAICKALNLSIADIVREAEGGEVAEPMDHQPAVVRNSSGDRTSETVAIPTNLPVGTYALKVTNSSMESTSGRSYYIGGHVVVAPCESLISGKDYIFRIEESLVIARYETDGRRHILNYLNPSFPHEILSEEPDVKGQVIGFQIFDI